MVPDYHLHTPLCKHARGSVSEFAEQAAAKGIPEICFTDHMPNPDRYDPAHRMSMTQFPAYRDMVSGLQTMASPNILFGIEADYYDGCERFLREWLPAQAFDLVIGSIHYIQNWGFDNPSERHTWDTVDVAAVWRRYFESLDRMVGSRLFDVVGHLDLPKKFGHRPSDRILGEMARPVLDRISDAGMAIELNTSGLRKPVGEIYPSIFLLSLAKDRDIPICFGSDAHGPDEVGADFNAALDLARDAGYTQYMRMGRRLKELVPLPEPGVEG